MPNHTVFEFNHRSCLYSGNAALFFNENIFISFEIFPPRKFIHANNFSGGMKKLKNKTPNYSATKNVTFNIGG